MKKIILFLIIFCGVCFARDIPQPPVDQKLSVQTQQFLKTVADNFNNLTVVITKPNGNRRGNYGDVVLLSSGGSYYIEVCISEPSGTSWLGILLTNVP